MIYQQFLGMSLQTKGLILVDRDNTLIYDSGYFHEAGQVRFIPSTLEVLQRVKGNLVSIMLVSNQSGIGQRIFTFDDAISVNNRIFKDLNAIGIQLSGAVFCPHTQYDACDCRKPNPSMLEFCIRLSGLTKDRIFFLGDKESDRLAAINAGVAFGWMQNYNLPLQIANWMNSLC